MTPTEFVIQMAGIYDVVGDGPPTREQWNRIQDKIGEAMGYIASKRLLEGAQELIARREDEAIQAQKMQTYYDQIAKQQQQYVNPLNITGVSVTGTAGPFASTAGAVYPSLTSTVA